MTLHKCPVPSCRRLMPARLLMCGPHWRLVPMPIRTRIWRAYRPSQLDGAPPSRHWRAAVREAVECVTAVIARADPQLSFLPADAGVPARGRRPADVS